ncbi:MAG TPA: VanW family protein [Coleofasciculaceae cyanobacterium]|jgi:vancomycin resistance protein YoaR
MVSKTYSTRSLNQAQLTNLRVAVKHLDGLVLRPGDSFSFNRVVGPRTAPRGYRLAPSYLGGESPASMGGGICLLSSAVYQLVLEAGLPIQERVPHLRTIHSVPPGLDATVWYGQADLKFANSLPIPLRVTAKLRSGSLQLGLQGEKVIDPVVIQRITRKLNPEQVQVTVLRAGQVVSSDRYRLSPGG